MYGLSAKSSVSRSNIFGLLIRFSIYNSFLQTMSKKSMVGCCWFVVIFPVIFYSPKFLEYRYHQFEHTFKMSINCTNYVFEQTPSFAPTVSFYAAKGQLKLNYFKKQQKLVLTFPYLR